MVNSSKTRRVKKRNSFIALMLVAALAITGALAYLTAKDSATNKFTVGNVDIDLTEPSWVEGNGENVVPGQVIAKDPTITNTGKNDAFVYLMVSVPKADDITVVDESTKTSTKVNDLQLFSYELDSGWTLVDSKIDNDDLYNYYLYAYNTALAPEAKTAPAFSTVKFANIAEGQFTEENNKLQILVDGYAIQSDFYNNEAGETATAASAWNLYVRQNNWAWPSNPATAHYSFVGYRRSPVKTFAYSSAEDDVVMPTPVSTEFNEVTFNGWVSESGKQYKVGDEVKIDALYILDEKGNPININPVLRETVISSTDGDDTVSTLPVKLMPKNDTCRTVIIRNDILNTSGHYSKYVSDSSMKIESNVDGYKDEYYQLSFGDPTTEYPYTFNEGDNWYICGIEPGTTLKDFISSYVRVQGDGRLEVITSCGAMVGTGTVVNVYDRHGTETVEDDTLVERFTVIVYGDVNGDSYITNKDGAMVNFEALGGTGWSLCEDDTFNRLYVLAGDCNKDGRINATDWSMIVDDIEGAVPIEQTFIRSFHQ